MKVMVIGRGGREHSIIQKLAESEGVTKIYAAPGNAGVEAERVEIAETEQDQLVAFAKEKEVDLTIVGPENPLLDGLVDRFREAGLRVFGPNQKAALIEGSKHFAKKLMADYNIPTADYAAFTDVEEAKAYIREKGAPIVVKADGLAAGKGVVVAQTLEEALESAEDMLVNGQFGEASREIVVEEFLAGKEFSLMAFVNGRSVYPMTSARDHKRAFEGDRGPNTGGMGAFAPVPDLSADDYHFAVESILQPTADAMVEEGRPFTGILYAGLILTKEGPKVIEFNARFGDPETQVVLPLIENPLEQVFTDVLDGRDPYIRWKEAACAGVVVASKGYPGSYEKGKPVPVISTAETFTVHAGTETSAEGYVSSGGRVLLVGSQAENLTTALENVYEHLQQFDGNKNFYYRRDIGLSSITSTMSPNRK
ncbi:phosphoribosylamine--glycine ligase [Halobacillus litoralis]|uniref:phosphoribosylamine--glycine ligase n=1 Tax=Halobacillus litoralis TaxID=45668 RepID=UPI001CD622F2|nr:phosphoribosylamine--glycine ligase [Halobacillus litoralis]MCA0970614.1 phosphoribosylamine--glycine ligase [Halobacillus litoralis]